MMNWVIFRSLYFKILQKKETLEKVAPLPAVGDQKSTEVAISVIFSINRDYIKRQNYQIKINETSKTYESLYFRCRAQWIREKILCATGRQHRISDLCELNKILNDYDIDNFNTQLINIYWIQTYSFWRREKMVDLELMKVEGSLWIVYFTSSSDIKNYTKEGFQ